MPDGSYEGTYESYRDARRAAYRVARTRGDSSEAVDYLRSESQRLRGVREGREVAKANELFRAIQAGALDQDPLGVPKRFTNPAEQENLGYNPRTQWKTEDGTIIDFKDMEDEHLERAINFMERRQRIYDQRARDAQNKALRLRFEKERRERAKALEAEMKAKAEAEKERKRLEAAKAVAKKAYDEAMEAALKGTDIKTPVTDGRKFRE